VFDNGVDIAKLQPFFCGQFQLPANTLFGEKGRPAALPGIRLRGSGEVVIKIEAKLRLVAPLVETC
jgi:hypothetical protein